MLIVNEQHKQLNATNVTAELKILNSIPTPSITDVQTALGSYYNQALQLQGAKYQFTPDIKPTATAAASNPAAFFSGIGSKILDDIKGFVCSTLDGTSTEDQIIQTVLDALTSIIPGGVLIKTLAQLVVKYVISTGITNFCAVPTPPAPPAPAPPAGS